MIKSVVGDAKRNPKSVKFGVLVLIIEKKTEYSAQDVQNLLETN